MEIPARPVGKDQLFDQLDQAKKRDFPWRSGRAFAYTFDAGREVEEVARRAFTQFMSENALDPTVYPSLLRFENDIVSMARAHLGGDERVVGNFTSGGTESILLAVKSARDWARETRPSAAAPEMILPITGHAAFHKAAHYFGIKVVAAPVDDGFRADAAAVRKLITPNTILIVGSASSYAHGVVDPIAELGAIAEEHGLWLHVDACIGGFLLPYFRRLGTRVPEFDFRVAGVSSMSMDLHKYAFCPKGASVVLYRNKGLRKFQLFACSDWTGYTMLNTTVQSTKSGGPMAAAWTVMQFIGDEGYLEIARGLLQTRDQLVAGINAIDGLSVMGNPEMCLVAFSSNEMNIFALGDAMRDLGWYVQPQLAFESSKENLHLSINPSNVPLASELLADLAKCARNVADLRDPALELEGQLSALVEMFSSVDASSLGEHLPALLSAVGMKSSSDTPERLALINTLLNRLPRDASRQLLITYVNELFVPTA
jgi:glutamate/tyrosine decarboxylase-like PLP-dependent enzyme